MQQLCSSSPTVHRPGLPACNSYAAAAQQYTGRGSRHATAMQQQPNSTQAGAHSVQQQEAVAQQGGHRVCAATTDLLHEVDEIMRNHVRSCEIM